MTSSDLISISKMCATQLRLVLAQADDSCCVQGIISRCTKTLKDLQSNLGITATVNSGHLANYGHLPRSRTIVHWITHNASLLMRPLCNAYYGQVFATYAYKCMQLTSLYSGRPYFFEVDVYSMVRTGAEVNNVCCYIRSLINGRYCFYDAAYLGSLVRPVAEGNQRSSLHVVH